MSLICLSTLFPDDFMFQLTSQEVEIVKSQIVTSRNSSFFSGQLGGHRKPPYAFTEQGIYMLATVLHGDTADKQTIFIMRTFREMRRFIASNAYMFDRISSVELRQIEYEKKRIQNWARFSITSPIMRNLLKKSFWTVMKQFTHLRDSNSISRQAPIV